MLSNPIPTRRLLACACVLTVLAFGCSKAPDDCASGTDCDPAAQPDAGSDPCATGNGGCPASARCSVVAGLAACTCLEGFTDRDGVCVSDDPCEVGGCGLACEAGFLRCGEACCAATSVAVGGYHTCATTRAGGVRCWGQGSLGERGDGLATPPLGPSDVVGLEGEVAISVVAGNSFNCAVLQSGRVACWGSNIAGQLGDGTLIDRHTPVFVTGLTTARAVACGGESTCALLAGGTVKCWGRNDSGNLGDGTTTRRETPVDVVGLSSVTALAAGNGDFFCAIASGGVKCWGSNFHAQLGLPSGGRRESPVDVAGATSGASLLSVGNAHVCAKLGDEVRCWGAAGPWLVDGPQGDSSSPIVVPGLTGVIALGHNRGGGFAITAQHDLLAWGNPTSQIAEDLPPGPAGSLPVAAVAGRAAFAQGAGGHACALTTNGQILCWGHNADGEVGDGTTTFREGPVYVSSE